MSSIAFATTRWIQLLRPYPLPRRCLVPVQYSSDGLVGTSCSRRRRGTSNTVSLQLRPTAFYSSEHFLQCVEKESSGHQVRGIEQVL